MWISLSDSLRDSARTTWIFGIGSCGMDSITDVAVIGPSFVTDTVVVAIILSLVFI